MYRLFLLLLLTTNIVTANDKPLEIMDKNITKTYPFAYAALGNIIYENAPKIEKLKDIEAYKIFSEKIEKYIKRTEDVMKEGFLLNELSSEDQRKSYLEKLRELAVTNDFFVRSVDDKFNLALESENTELFSQLLDSGLVDVKKYKKAILEYYYKHKDSIEPEGVIKSLLQEKKVQKSIQKRVYKSKRALDLERIREIRERDRREQERLEKQLQEELERKKMQIREYQKKELSKTK